MATTGRQDRRAGQRLVGALGAVRLLEAGEARQRRFQDVLTAAKGQASVETAGSARLFQVFHPL
ncbi:MAG TPA: hypothetical protein VIB82_09455, partial [Caulobacteraceae bacterium]